MAKRSNHGSQPSLAGMTDQPPARTLGSILELGWQYARDVVLMTDCRSGIVVDANPEAEKVTGYSRAELIGIPQRLLYPEAERVLSEQTFQDRCASPGTVAEFRILCKDGRTLPVEVSTSAAFNLNGQCLVVCLLRDISKAKEHKRTQAINSWALKAYASAAIALARAHSSASLMQEICAAITHDSHFVLAWIGFAEEGPGKPVRIAGAAGPALPYLDGLTVSWDENEASGRGATGIVLRTGGVHVMEDSETDPIFRPWRERARKVGIRSTIAASFQVDVGPRGALMVCSPKPHSFHQVEIEAFTHLAQEIGIGLHARLQAERLEAERQERERAQRELAEALEALVGAITTAMRMRDPFTAGHEKRVADLAAAVARDLRWPEDQIEALRVAALVHDIGKISVPLEILAKPAALTPPEWELIKQHPETGYAILKDVPFQWPIAETVRQHHERWNGSGYPRGLKGNDILLGARILAVADVVDSLASDRPYRPALEIDGVLREIELEAGTLLDPELVRACIGLFREKRFALPPLKLI
ncbi:MAG: HD domain-containing phosphohydrolase [Terracidiphilus sp.]